MATRSEARKARWAKMKPEDKSKLQSKIAKKAWAGRSKKARTERAKKMAEARWGKKK